MLLPLLGTATLPDTSGDVFQEPYSVKATNDVWPLAVWVFNDTATRIGLSGSFIMPVFSGSLSIKPFWTSTATSGNCVWDFEYRAITGDDAESLDQAGTQESVTVTDAAPTASRAMDRAPRTTR